MSQDMNNTQKTLDNTCRYDSSNIEIAILDSEDQWYTRTKVCIVENVYIKNLWLIHTSKVGGQFPVIKIPPKRILTGHFSLFYKILVFFTESEHPTSE